MHNPPVPELDVTSAISCPQRDNNVTFTRLLLAVMVLLSHSCELLDGNRSREPLTRIFHTISFGELTVDGFFLLSGYLIVESWQRRPRAAVFLWHRVLRIYPAFIVATLVSGLLAGPLGSNPTAYFAIFNVQEFFSAMLVLAPPHIPPVFVGTHYPWVNGPMWTIRYEFVCYLLVLLAGFCGVLTRRSVWLASFLIIAALDKFPYVRSEWADVWRFYAFFFAGGCFFFFREVIPYRKPAVVFSLCLVFIGLHYNRLVDPVLLTFGAYAFFAMAFSRLPILSRLDRYGDISYGVYLYGWPIQKLLIWYGISSSPWCIFLLTCMLSFTAGALSWHCLEKKCLRLKSRIDRTN